MIQKKGYRQTRQIFNLKFKRPILIYKKPNYLSTLIVKKSFLKTIIDSKIIFMKTVKHDTAMLLNSNLKKRSVSFF